jgi:hypothetical protein
MHAARREDAPHNEKPQFDLSVVSTRHVPVTEE